MGKERKHYTDLINSIGKCELCGSKRGIEAHHIIPLVAEFSELDLDIEDNIIIVCSSCHAKLTNRSLLTKYGLRKIIVANKCRESFYAMIDEKTGDSELDAIDIIDTFDEWLDCTYNKIFYKNH